MKNTLRLQVKPKIDYMMFSRLVKRYMKRQKQKESLRYTWPYKLKKDTVISPKIEFKQNQTKKEVVLFIHSINIY